MRVEFTVPVLPVGRPKLRVGIKRLGEPCPHCGKLPDAIGYLYPSATAKEAERALRSAIVARVVPQALNGPVRLLLRIVLRRPQALIWANKEMPPVWAPVKPDADNVVGLVQDTLQALGFFRDQQVVRLDVEKFYAAGPGYGDTRPRIAVRMEEIEG